jgi:hypothetical protein
MMNVVSIEKILEWTNPIVFTKEICPPLRKSCFKGITNILFMWISVNIEKKNLLVFQRGKKFSEKLPIAFTKL